MSTPLSVLKFGGSSVGSPERIHRVARIIAAHKKRGDRIVVVVSAMADTTDDLIDLAKKVSPNAQKPSHRREMDMLLTTGERVSMALLSMALGDLGLEAISFTGSQSGIITTSIHGEAHIKEIRPVRILESLAKGKITIVAGFQGVSEEKEITTLGRGGSDTSAVALGAQLGAEEVFIYTDVDGIYSADPRKVPSAKKLTHVSAGLAYIAASRGAQVLHHRCLEFAVKSRTPVRVLSSFLSDDAIEAGNFFKNGTLIESDSTPAADGKSFVSILCRTSPDSEKYERGVSRISLVGGGLQSHSRLQSTLAELFAEEGLTVTRLDVSNESLEYCFEENPALDALIPKIHDRVLTVA